MPTRIGCLQADASKRDLEIDVRVGQATSHGSLLEVPLDNGAVEEVFETGKLGHALQFRAMQHVLRKTLRNDRPVFQQRACVRQAQRPRSRSCVTYRTGMRKRWFQACARRR